MDLTIQKIVKNHEDRHATTISALKQVMSYDQLDFAWTHFLVFVVIKDMAASITYLKNNYPKRRGLFHW